MKTPVTCIDKLGDLVTFEKLSFYLLEESDFRGIGYSWSLCFQSEKDRGSVCVHQGYSVKPWYLMENQVGRLRTGNDQPLSQTAVWWMLHLPALAQDGMQSPFQGLLAARGEAALEHLHFPYALPAKCYTPASCRSAHAVLIRAPGCQHVHPIKGCSPPCHRACWQHDLAPSGPALQAIWQRSVLHYPCLHILPLHFQLACPKPRLSECWAIASRGELGLFMTNRCCLADVGTIWGLLKK